MWGQRLRGLFIIILSGLLAFGVVRYLAAKKNESNGLSLRFSPAVIEEKVLGVMSRIQRINQRDSAVEIGEEASRSVQIIEQKSRELIEELKKLPQKQIEIIKKQLFKQVCEEIVEEK
ncbi:MAG TPA: hypothetical protein VMW41_05580 [Candidatus Bathyarchaeia archaeon]|nr:hypothetical protein [Candidatus Bathyarchaeia archaeon]